MSDLTMADASVRIGFPAMLSCVNFKWPFKPLTALHAVRTEKRTSFSQTRQRSQTSTLLKKTAYLSMYVSICIPLRMDRRLRMSGRLSLCLSVSSSALWAGTQQEGEKKRGAATLIRTAGQTDRAAPESSLALRGTEAHAVCVHRRGRRRRERWQEPRGKGAHASRVCGEVGTSTDTQT